MHKSSNKQERLSRLSAVAERCRIQIIISIRNDPEAPIALLNQSMALSRGNRIEIKHLLNNLRKEKKMFTSCLSYNFTV